jgi:hypothetical protein
VIRGIGVERFASPPGGMGAVFVDASDVTLSGVVVRQNAGLGISVIGDRNVVRSTAVEGNGQLGLHADSSRRLTIEQSLLQDNNTERFAITHAEGGLKLTRSREVLVRGNVSRRNHGRGMWFDISCYGVRIVRNVISDNADRGLQYEISAKAVIAGNVVAENAGDGLVLIESADVDVYNNSVRNNRRALFVVESDRSNSDPAIPYDVSDVVVRNNLFTAARPGTPQLVATQDVTRRSSSSAMGVSLDYDGYHRSSATRPTYLLGWASYPAAYAVFRDLATFAARTGNERHGTYVTSAVGTLLARPGTGVLALRRSAGRGVTAPLPAPVAEALAVPAGTVPALGAGL